MLDIVSTNVPPAANPAADTVDTAVIKSLADEVP